mgnify:CR=1 FL=1
MTVTPDVKERLESLYLAVANDSHSASTYVCDLLYSGMHYQEILGSMETMFFLYKEFRDLTFRKNLLYAMDTGLSEYRSLLQNED